MSLTNYSGRLFRFVRRGFAIRLYLNLPPFSLSIRNRDSNFQNPVVKLCLCLFRIHTFRQRNSSVEEPKLPFTPPNLSFCRIALNLPFSLKDKRIVLHLHSYVIRRQPWELCKNAVFSIPFGDLDRRGPGNTGACFIF
ncbi:MAG: hypothetical protein JWQ42_2078 [Edaphobacter sp.]|nr:hypothetical protein [Edaphobacter sp.]